jgi:hypothetical protein
VVFGEDDASGEYEIDATGSISVRLLGRVKLKAMTVSEVKQMLTAQPGLFQEHAALRRAHQPAALLDPGPVDPGPGREGRLLPLHQWSDGGAGGGDRRRLHLSGLEKSITIQRIGALKEEPVTEDAPVYPGDVICVPERFLKQGERLAACRQREADLPAGVRRLYGRVHNKIRRECA